MLPYVLGLNITNKKEYYKFIKGEGEEQFIAFIKRHEELYTDIRMEKENMKKTFKKIYQFIVCVMNRDKYVLESKDIKNIRLYEETISDIFQCINHLYDFEICHEEELEE